MRRLAASFEQDKGNGETQVWIHPKLLNLFTLVDIKVAVFKPRKKTKKTPLAFGAKWVDTEFSFHFCIFLNIFVNSIKK